MTVPFRHPTFKRHRIYVSTLPTLPDSASAGSWSTSGRSGPAAGNSCGSFVVSLRAGQLQDGEKRREAKLKQIAIRRRLRLCLLFNFIVRALWEEKLLQGFVRCFSLAAVAGIQRANVFPLYWIVAGGLWGSQLPASGSRPVATMMMTMRTKECNNNANDKA